MAAPLEQVAAPLEQVEAPLEQVAAPLEQVEAPLEQVAAPLEQYKKVRSIGGTNSKFFEYLHLASQQTVAVKKISKQVHERVNTTREMYTLQQLNHVNVVRWRELQESNTHWYLVLEYVDTNLRTYMNLNPNFINDQIRIRSFVFDILRGLAYCHSQGVMHRDLKLHSMLLDSQNNSIKIAGFGQSRMFPTRSGVYTPKVGTLRYKSPEILLGSKRYSPSIDMWSVGCIFAEMLLSRQLFSGNCVREQLVVIFSIVGTPNKNTWPGFSDMPDFEPSFYTIPRKPCGQPYNGKFFDDFGSDIFESPSYPNVDTFKTPKTPSKTQTTSPATPKQHSEILESNDSSEVSLDLNLTHKPQSADQDVIVYSRKRKNQKQVGVPLQVEQNQESQPCKMIQEGDLNLSTESAENGKIESDGEEKSEAAAKELLADEAHEAETKKNNEAMVAEIKELKENKHTEDDFLRAIAAAHRQSLIPHLEYEYPDIRIHEDLYKLVQYSCEEMCSTKEPVNKAMKLWTTFMEPILGVPPHPDCKKKTSGSGNENTSAELNNLCRTALADGNTVAKESFQDLDRVGRDDLTCSTRQLEKEQKDADAADKRSGNSIQVATGECVANSTASRAIGAENRHGRTGTEATSACATPLSPAMLPMWIINRKLLLIQSLHQRVEKDGAKGSKYHEESVGPSKDEKEEGEMSPNGDFEEDNFGVYGDAGMKATAKAKHSVESRNEEGDCVVKVMSAPEEHEEEEDVERDEVDGKAESEAKELLADESHDAETKKNNKGCDNMKQKQDKESIYRHHRSSQLHFAKGFMHLSLAPQMMMQKLSTWRMEFAQLSCWQSLC
ncbi:hypothetical protein EZV62_016840 [Acer yangbiense]|uniref:cyclin-dependent kinase n=1 Tax=Acer yangbiense TaxID=1000413 RepID=A0A5C7HPT2_9ROSI|nr:hypothetical protein EZV62_016840 [Acer yangbiense]